jgi:hypothetical protein
VCVRVQLPLRPARDSCRYAATRKEERNNGEPTKLDFLFENILLQLL